MAAIKVTLTTCDNGRATNGNRCIVPPELIVVMITLASCVFVMVTVCGCEKVRQKSMNKFLNPADLVDQNRGTRMNQLKPMMTRATV